MRLIARLAVPLAALIVSAPLSAQGAGVNASALDSARVTADRVVPDSAARDGASPAAVGAPLTGLRAGLHAAERPRADQPTLAAPRAGLGQARAMMVVGLGALIAGAIIGGTPGTIIMVGGAVIGLVGLYDYLQ